ncbi:hypothetical protein [Pararhodobacter aggregans]|uniref:DUF2336 domain-containing protein n=1 Tax=Pararhodobacter aggregans TaxID=404875 RepID=A0A2T7UL55_9RHOB|nr:hypothetical protein [Pararhodobacter aggregans]PTX05385.1 hypothetical protein C8N33_101804 [Pararhodobacter aggregans]PVE45371.1 hypothetical protein DDE23_21505 [Pararhodobacter aggregans]
MIRNRADLRPLRPLARLLAGAALALTLAAGLNDAAATTPVPGAEAEAFVAARDAWLADDEGTALPALATLAAEGNAAARVLLGQIDKMPALQGPYLAHLPRAQRIALLRAPGGMSGRSWLAEEAGHPLVAAWIALRTPGGGPDLITRFEALDEPRAAREALVTLAAREHPDLTTVDPAAVDGDLLYLLWRAADAPHRAAIADLVPVGSAQWQMMGEVMDTPALERWLMASTAAEPLLSLCRALCDDDQMAACLGAAYGALGSHDALLTLGSPAESLIAQEEFLNSPRGRASTMRRILLASSMRARRAMLDRVSSEVSCLGDALRAEAQRYRPALPGVSDGG